MNEHIRHILVWGWTERSVRSDFHQLKQAKFLQTLTLDSGFGSIHHEEKYSVAKAAEAMRPFVKAIRKQKDHIGVEDDIVDSIFVDQATWGHLWPERNAAEIKRAEDYTTALRTELKRLLA